MLDSTGTLGDHPAFPDPYPDPFTFDGSHHHSHTGRYQFLQTGGTRLISSAQYEDLRLWGIAP